MENIQDYIQQFQLPIAPTVMHELKLVCFEKNEPILIAGEQINAFYLLIEGKYQVTTTEVTGKSLLLRFCSSLSLLGDIEYFQNLPIQSDITATTNCRLIEIPFTVYEHFLKQTDFNQYLLEELSYKLHTCTIASRVNSTASVETRFAAYLCTIHEDGKFGQQLIGNHPHDIASLIGTTPRHLNRVIKKWSELRILSRLDQQLQIHDWDTIQKLSEQIRYE
ncbi:transcriptional regulator [Bacillaceae bacterium SAS-127]|nr:transcriptional regulator [Bacillaceae bacterium SAS-127]